MVSHTAYIPWQELEEFTCQVFQRTGMPPENARLVAGTLAQANLRGIDTHGIDLVPSYYRRLKAGALNPRPQLKVVRETPAMMVLDGDDGPGQVASFRAMQEAVKKARQTGLGWVSVRNSNHQGALAYFSLLAVERDMIGVTATNAPPVMAPWGGLERHIGNNPLAIAVPAGRHRPLVLDMAMSVVANGKIRLALEKGEAIPGHWAIDKLGNPTMDPRAVEGGSAVPFGTYKGYGLAMMMEVLAGVLVGANFATHIGRGTGYAGRNQNPWGIGHLLMAIDPAAFGELAEFKSNVDSLIEEMKEAPKAPGVSEIYVPGEIEWNRVPVRQKEGVPVHEFLFDHLKAIAGELELEFPWKLVP